MGGRVLVVDADPDIRRLERRILQFYGYEVTSAADDAQALAAIARDPPDLIVIDVQALRQHRRELDATLAASGLRRSILLVSTSDDDERSGVPVLRRPFGVDDLRQAVAKALHPNDV